MMDFDLWYETQNQKIRASRSNGHYINMILFENNSRELEILYMMSQDNENNVLKSKINI